MHPPSPDQKSISPLRIVAAGTAARLDIDAPNLGLAVSGNAGGEDDRLLGVDLRAACRAADHWIRGEDVVAVYEPADSRLLRATAMWRPCAAVGGAAWEVVVSAQTALEQSDASLAVTCELAADTILWAVEDADRILWHETPPPHAHVVRGVLVRRGGTTGSSVLIGGFPGDVRRIMADVTNGRGQIACWVFSSAAEKGVLFRGRVLAAVGPATDETSWATAALLRYAATPPFLTT